jgi:excisionase family DNA binding protein
MPRTLALSVPDRASMGQTVSAFPDPDLSNSSVCASGNPATVLAAHARGGFLVAGRLAAGTHHPTALLKTTDTDIQRKVAGWIGTRDACHQLGVTLRALYRLIDEGQLPAYKMGRVIRLRAEDVDDFAGRHPFGDGPAGVREPRVQPPSSPAGFIRLEPPG